ncbi:hypothetical protein C4580_04590 [Candidatus Woesearchaeota archaeon]|nr:MAG: hypothetical protein C4580_04590 [Candidatus Woesearchaeota archaeon]
MEEEQHKGIALVLLGIVAVIAVVGLVLMYVQDRQSTALGVYGGAIKQVEYPYWTGRGVPRNMPGAIPGDMWAPGMTSSGDLTTHWNYQGDPKRDPKSDIPSALSKCGRGGFLVPYVSDNGVDANYYRYRGYAVVDTGDQKAGVCVYPNEPMVGGIAGQ